MIVFENLDLPGGGSPQGMVEIELWGAGQPVIGRSISDGTLIAGKATLRTNSEGIWSADLIPNGDIEPANTTYRCRRFVDCSVFTSYLNVPASGGPFDAFLIGEDAMNEIPSSALAVHAGNLDLHGGGIEVDYAEIISNVNVTGGATTLAVVPGLNVSIPDLDRPCYISTEIHLVSLSGTVDGVVGIAPWDGVSSTVGLFSLIDGGYAEDTDTDGTPKSVHVTARINPHSSGLYTVAAERATSPYAIQVLASTLVKSKVWAVTR